MPTFREDPKLGSKVPMIKTADLNEQCVTNSKILDGCITKEKLAKGTVDATTLANKSVGTEKLSDSSVTNEKISNKAVSTEKLADGSITKEKIFNASITTEKLANESVSAEKLQSGLRNTIASTYDKTIELDNQKANITDVGNAIERLENKIGERILVEGDVTNLPDEEDLTSVSTIDGREVMKLNDRAYEPSNFSGKGYKILRKNIKKFDIPTVSIVVSYAPASSGDITITVNDKVTTINLDSTTDTTPAIVATKIAAALKSSLDDYDVSVSSNRITLTRYNDSSVSPSSINVGSTSAVITVIDGVNKNVRKNILTDDMIDKPNTIYEIKYDFCLNGQEISIPYNCTLQFKGGSLKNGIINGNNTVISANVVAIFKNITLNNTFSIKELLVEWFGVIPNTDLDNSTAINKAIDNAININVPLFFTNNTYYIYNSIILKSKICIKGKYGIEKTPQIIYKGQNNCCEIYNSKHISICNISIVRDNYNKIKVDTVDDNINGICFHNGMYRLQLDNCSFFGFNYALFVENTINNGMSYNNIFNCQFRKNNIAIYFEGYTELDNNSLLSYCTYTTINRCIFSKMKRGAVYISVHSDIDIVNISDCNIEIVGYGDFFSESINENFGLYFKNYSGINNNVNVSNCYMENIYHYDNSTKVESFDYTNNFSIGVENIHISITNTNNINCLNFVKCFGKDYVYINKSSFNGNKIRYKNIICIPNMYTNLNINSFFSYTELFDIINCNIINESKQLALNSILIALVKSKIYTITSVELSKQTKQYNSLILYVSSKNDDRLTNSGLIYNSPMQLKSCNIALSILELYITDMINIEDQSIENAKTLLICNGSISVLKKLHIKKANEIQIRDITLTSNGNNTFIKVYKEYRDKNLNICFIRNTFEGDNTITLFEGEASNIVTPCYATMFLNACKKNASIKVLAYDNNIRIPVSLDGDNIFGEENIMKYSGITVFGNPKISINGQPFIDETKKMPSWVIDNQKVMADGYSTRYNRKGYENERPTLQSSDEGFEYYDSTLKKKILWNGTEWTNMDGTAL